MKNYDEMATDVFRRIEEYNIAEKRKRKKFIRAVSSACCLCLVALVSVGIWKSGWLSPSPNQTTDDPLTTETNHTFHDLNTESINDQIANNKIIIHEMESISSDRMLFNLSWDDFVPMDYATLNDYYGTDVFPNVPNDLKEWEDQQYGIFRRENGTGEVYWDGNVLNYSNEDFTRSVNMELQKGRLPFSCYGFYESMEEKSIINSTEIYMGHSPNGYYYAEFIYRNVGFRIVADGLSEDEIVEVISSLID